VSNPIKRFNGKLPINVMILPKNSCDVIPKTAGSGKAIMREGVNQSTIICKPILLTNNTNVARNNFGLSKHTLKPLFNTEDPERSDFEISGPY
jgi:hypothetical protein